MKKTSGGTPVYLNVYDLHQANYYGYPVGLGAFHTGVEISGKEYAFGGHDYSFTGVFEMEPRNAYGAVFREAILLGETNLSRQEIQAIIDELSAEFSGNSYHPFSRNCNSFSNELSMRIFGTPIPGYINRLPYLGSVFSCLIPPSGMAMLGLTLPTAKNSASSSDSLSPSPSPRTPRTPRSPRSGDFVAFSGSAFNLSGLGSSMGTDDEEIVPDSDEARREKALSAAYKRLNSSKGMVL